MNNPLISIIIPLFNREHLIRFTIQSVIEQTYTNWECIIIDDKSLDSSFLVAASYSEIDCRVKVFRNETVIKGPSICRQKGLELSTGEYIIYLDSDDLLTPWALENRLNFIKLNSNLDVLLSNGIYYNFCSKVFGIETTKFRTSRVLEEYYNFNVVFQTTAPTWSRKFLVDNNIVWDKDIVQWDDVDYAIQAFQCKPIFFWGEEVPDYIMRRDDNHISLTNNDDILLKLLTNFKTYEKWRVNVPNKSVFQRNFINYMLNKIEFNLKRPLIFQLLTEHGTLLKKYFGIGGYLYLFFFGITKDIKIIRGIIFNSRFLFLGFRRDIKQVKDDKELGIKEELLGKLNQYNASNLIK